MPKSFFPGGSDSGESPAVQEIWVQSLGWADPQRREWLPTPVFSCLENRMDGGAWWAGTWWAATWGHKELDAIE